jgi:hypothetical protein
MISNTLTTRDDVQDFMCQFGPGHHMVRPLADSPFRCHVVHNKPVQFTLLWPTRFLGQLVSGSIRLGEVTHNAPCDLRIPPVQHIELLTPCILDGAFVDRWPDDQTPRKDNP